MKCTERRLNDVTVRARAKVSVLDAAVDRSASAATNQHFSTALRDTLGEEQG